MTYERTSGAFRVAADTFPAVAANEHLSVPVPIASVRFLPAAFLWGWPWALAHRLYKWALADLLFSAAALVGRWLFLFGIACLLPDQVQEPAAAATRELQLMGALTAVMFGCALTGAWLAWRIITARRGAVLAWQNRFFRDAAEFRAVQRAWLAAGVLFYGGLLLLLLSGSFDFSSAGCGPSG